MSIYFTKESIKYFSRRQEVYLNDNDLGNKLNLSSNLQTILNIGKSLLENNDKVIIFGEIYGSGVYNMGYQESLDNKVQFRVFDVFIFGNKNYSLSLEKLKSIFPLHCLAPIQKDVKTLRQWLLSELPSQSSLNGRIEGLVYKPLNGQDLILNCDSIMNYIGVKHKSKEFFEVKSEKVQKQYTSEELKFKEDVERYFTMNRLDNLLSKGYRLSTEELKYIIPAYLSDVKEDYLRDNDYFNDKIFNKLAGKVATLVKDKLQLELDKLN